jgi:hypothetical protein
MMQMIVHKYTTPDILKEDLTEILYELSESMAAKVLDSRISRFNASDSRENTSKPNAECRDYLTMGGDSGR